MGFSDHAAARGGGDLVMQDGPSWSPPQHPPSVDRSPLEVFRSVTMIDVLEQDQRPAFVLDLKDRSVANTLQPLYFNPALANIEGLLDVVAGLVPPDPYGQSAHQTYSTFKKWALDPALGDKSRAPCIYHGMSWTSMTINMRWRMVNGIPRERQERGSSGAFAKATWGPKAITFVDKREGEANGGLDPEPISEADLRSSSASFLLQALGTITKQPAYDWTAPDPPPNASDHISLARSIDWGATPLGPMSSWSSRLRHTANLLMVTPHPAIVFWGPELTIIYNEAYPPLVADKHPRLLGKSPLVGFAEAWHLFEPFYRKCAEAGRGATFDDMQLFLDRGFGHQEETYYSLSFIPIVDDDNRVLGWYEPVIETTKKKIGERRTATYLEVGERTATAKDLKSFWSQLLRGLDPNVYDVSFALIYSVMEDGDALSVVEHDPSDSKPPCTKRLDLEGSIGVPRGHAVAPYHASANHLTGITQFFLQAFEAQDPLFLTTADGSLPENLVKGLHSRGFLDPCESVVIMKIVPTTGHLAEKHTVLGFLVLGLNTRRPYDEEYRQFIRVLSRQINTSVAAVLLFEEEARRGRTIAEQAELEQRMMEEKLRLRTTELEKRNQQLKHFADCVPVGIYVMDFSPEHPDGQYAYRNDKWFELTAGSRKPEYEVPAWKSPLWGRMYEEDVEKVLEKWDALLKSKSSTCFEFRVPKNRYLPPDKNTDVIWLLSYAFCILDEDGSVKSVIGSLTDITAQKWAEDVQRRRMEDALESKRQQENFIDVTSHEMRNPLSAIMISADDIIISLRALGRHRASTDGKFEEVVSSSIEAAQVIADCAQHQKRIVDDILTISKLDSGLFAITPVVIQPVDVVNGLLKMFEAEFASHKIDYQLVVHPTFNDLDITQLLLDSSRLRQILINLLTNAIKFTKFAETRRVLITMGASVEQSKTSLRGNAYLPHRKLREDLTSRLEWGQGQVIYLEFSVEDSGRGLTDDEKKVLFMRFSQAPKTHVNYGGSGLGLFISRELAEMQGGQIGVASAGKYKGSEFSFYIKARRTEQTVAALSLEPEDSVLSQIEAQSAYAVRSAVEHDINGAESASQQELASCKVMPLGDRQYHALIVEDNLVNQRVLQKQLLKLGYEVSIANHGEEALDFLLTTRYSCRHKADGKDLSVVLMDSEMPVMDGLTCVKRIREMQQDGVFIDHVPVIAITANARIEQVNAALAAGMDDVVAKPFRIPDLVAQIERLGRVLGNRKRKASA